VESLQPLQKVLRLSVARGRGQWGRVLTITLEYIEVLLA